MKTVAAHTPQEGTRIRPSNLTRDPRGRATRRPAPRYRPGRGLSRGEALILLALMLALVMCALASRAGAPGTVATTKVLVDRGDTLWAIARANQVPGLSTAQTADLIARLNDLSSGQLIAGTELAIPMAGPRTVALAAK